MEILLDTYFFVTYVVSGISGKRTRRSHNPKVVASNLIPPLIKFDRCLQKGGSAPIDLTAEPIGAARRNAGTAESILATSFHNVSRL